MTTDTLAALAALPRLAAASVPRIRLTRSHIHPEGTRL